MVLNIQSHRAAREFNFTFHKNQMILHLVDKKKDEKERNSLWSGDFTTKIADKYMCLKFNLSFISCQVLGIQTGNLEYDPNTH